MNARTPHPSLATEISHAHLDDLEAETIDILREVVASFERPALLFSGGKDSLVMLRCAEKAFGTGRLPFPLLMIDTGHNFPEVTQFRDHRAAELGAHLIVRSVEDSIARGTVRLTIARKPPPTSCLCLTSAKSGSMPVVSQSIMNAIVPDGAKTDTCALRKPCFVPRSSARSQASVAALARSFGSVAVGIWREASRCLPITRRNGFSFFLYSRNGPPCAAAVSADCT